MAFHIRDAATDSAVRKLARLKGKTLTETVREAVEREYAEITQAPPLIERLQTIQAAFEALRRPGGRPADKAFFDDLSGNP
jgi:antitoxin VapB